MLYEVITNLPDWRKHGFLKKFFPIMDTEFIDHLLIFVQSQIPVYMWR